MVVEEEAGELTARSGKVAKVREKVEATAPKIKIPAPAANSPSGNAGETVVVWREPATPPPPTPLLKQTLPNRSHNLPLPLAKMDDGENNPGREKLLPKGLLHGKKLI